MKTPAAHMTLWCQRQNQVFEFTVSVGIPVQVDTETWECSWSLGAILNHEGVPLKGLTSLLALASGISFISKFLEGRHELGDRFFFDSDLSEPIDHIPSILFGPSSDVEVV